MNTTEILNAAEEYLTSNNYKYVANSIAYVGLKK